MATTQLGSIYRAISAPSLKDVVLGVLGDFVADFDVPRLVGAFAEAVNANLEETGISVHGDEVYSVHPAPENAFELVRDAVKAVDLDGLMLQFEITHVVTVALCSERDAWQVQVHKADGPYLDHEIIPVESGEEQDAHALAAKIAGERKLQVVDHESPIVQSN